MASEKKKVTFNDIAKYTNFSYVANNWFSISE